MQYTKNITPSHVRLKSSSVHYIIPGSRATIYFVHYQVYIAIVSRTLVSIDVGTTKLSM